MVGADTPFDGAVWLADSSAWFRADRPEVAKLWGQALLAGQIAVSPIIELELLFSARKPDELQLKAEALAGLRSIPLTASIGRAALAAMMTLGSRSAGAHRVALPDYLIAASAEAAGLGVLHYDHHYDRLAEVMSFESRWIAPPGSL